jgi:predicted RNase H-like HicB family nuclease
MKKERIFNIIIHEAEEGGYWAECPTLEGCYSQGETIEEIHVNMKEAIELNIELLKSEKKLIPNEKNIYIAPIAI